MAEIISKLKLAKSYLQEHFKLTRVEIISKIHLCSLLIIKLISIIKDYLIHKLYFLSFVKLLCFLLLSYNAIQLTFEYLSFEYIYKLIVSDYKQEFDFPNINFCTDTNVFFDKMKIINKINSSVIWNNEDEEEKFFRENIEIIMNETNFTEIEQLTVSQDELFECNGKVHLKNGSDQAEMVNCLESLVIMKSIYGNQDFGICYKIVSKNRNIYLKDNDFLEILINSKFLSKFLTFLLFDGYFPNYYLFIDENNRNHFKTRNTALVIQSINFKAEIKIQKTSVNFLSKPYMDECIKRSKYIFFNK